MNLESVFLAYVDKVQSDFSAAKDSVKQLSNVRLIKPSEAVLQASVASVEQSEQFRNLTQRAAAERQRSPSTSPSALPERGTGHLLSTSTSKGISALVLAST